MVLVCLHAHTQNALQCVLGELVLKFCAISPYNPPRAWELVKAFLVNCGEDRFLPSMAGEAPTSSPNGTHGVLLWCLEDPVLSLSLLRLDCIRQAL